jgi:hypothetical protein
MKALRLLLLGISVGIPAHAQQPANPTQLQVQREGDNPIYKLVVNVVERRPKSKASRAISKLKLNSTTCSRQRASDQST